MSSPVAQIEISSIVEVPENQEEQKPVICKVLLKDGTFIEVTDEKTIVNNHVIARFFDLVVGNSKDQTKNDEVVVVPVQQFEPEDVRYVIQKTAFFADSISFFEITKEFAACSNDFSIPRLVQLMEVASFLDCTPVLKCLAKVAGEKLSKLDAEQIAEILNLPNDITEEEKERINERSTWFIQKPFDRYADHYFME